MNAIELEKIINITKETANVRVEFDTNDGNQYNIIDYIFDNNNNLILKIELLK